MHAPTVFQNPVSLVVPGWAVASADGTELDASDSAATTLLDVDADSCTVSAACAKSSAAAVVRIRRNKAPVRESRMSGSRWDMSRYLPSSSGQAYETRVHGVDVNVSG